MKYIEKEIMNEVVNRHLKSFGPLIIEKPDDFFKPVSVCFIFLEFNILTDTFAYFKSDVTFTFVTLIIPVTLGSFNS